MNTTSEAWEDKFDRTFTHRYHIAEHDPELYSSLGVRVDGKWEHIKAFIRQTRSEARIEAWERAREDSYEERFAGNRVVLEADLDRLIAEERSKQTQAAPADARP